MPCGISELSSSAYFSSSSLGRMSEGATGSAGRDTMIEITILSAIVLALFAYLVYALLQPEKF
jgi:K+-transporting ATPase KdpF subunit